jgi:hypothetical protein
MALLPLATVDDLETWLGQAVAVARADAILAAASTLVRSHTGRAWTDADGEWEDTATDLQQQIVREVTVRVAARVYTNPYGTTQETTGPFSRAVAAWSAMGMALTPDEREALPASIGGGIPGLSSVRVVAPM